MFGLALSAAAKYSDGFFNSQLQIVRGAPHERYVRVKHEDHSPIISYVSRVAPNSSTGSTSFLSFIFLTGLIVRVVVLVTQKAFEGQVKFIGRSLFTTRRYFHACDEWR